MRFCACAQAKLEPTGQRPATMERAAEADAAADRLEEAVAAAEQASSRGSSSTSAQGSCVDCPGCSASEQPSTSRGGHGQQQPVAGLQTQLPHSAQQQKFGVGASDDVDASYAASQRLLMLSGVKLRQHRLQRSIQLGPS